MSPDKAPHGIQVRGGVDPIWARVQSPAGGLDRLPGRRGPGCISVSRAVVRAAMTDPIALSLRSRVEDWRTGLQGTLLNLPLDGAGLVGTTSRLDVPKLVLAANPVARQVVE